MGSRTFEDECDVCALVDGDRTKKQVICCGTCSAHLCKDCNSMALDKVRRRAKAWFVRGMKGLPKRECK